MKTLIVLLLLWLPLAALFIACFHAWICNNPDDSDS